MGILNFVDLMVWSFFFCGISSVSGDGDDDVVECFEYIDILSATDNFHPTNFLGRGSHGSVYRANLINGDLAAVKIMKPDTFVGRDLDKSMPLSNEIEILSAIRDLGIVNLIGYSFSEFNHLRCRDPNIVVVEYMPNGSLHDRIHDKTSPPSYFVRVKHAVEIAKAIAVIHALCPPVIHRDIKPSNILIDRKDKARLGDFGLAIRIPGNCSCRPAGTMGYIDPSYVSPRDVTTKSDVFSFGIVLLELISGRKPIDVEYTTESVLKWVSELISSGELDTVWDLRITPPLGKLRSALIEVVMLAWRCVHLNPKERPEITEVVRSLKTARHRISPEKNTKSKSKKVSNLVMDCQNKIIDR